MTVIFEGKTGVATYQAIALKHALVFYAKTGMQVNRAYTPSKMMKLATHITSQKFKARDYMGAARSLQVWLDENGTSGSHPVLPPHGGQG